ncbi:MAG TPA: hypothetical protein VMB03_31700 [Bryobacteraceae bacterium]|nr:hypothetical protein [Bryobacteraceae bacterium]
MPLLSAFGQPAIGGGTCNSATLSGAYEVLLSGRQLTSAGAVTQIFQGVGTANFNGLSKVTVSLTANTVTTTQNFGTPITWNGTYSLQANCIGAMTITIGGTATFSLEAYTQPGSATVASGFAVIGSDSSYAYNGTGTMQPATCPSTISGAHEFNATGSGLTGAVANSTLDVAGMLQFDGMGNVTGTWTQVSNLTSTTVSAGGTYTVGEGCLASAVMTDTSNNKYTFSFSFSSASPNFGLIASSPAVIFDGTASAMQPTIVTSCAASTLNGTYYMTLAGRLAPSGAATKIQLANGTATFDGAGHVTFNLTASSVNGSQLFGAPLTDSGTYSLQSTCLGSINIASGDTATFNLVAYNFNTTTLQAKSFTMVGTDATYALNGSGSVQPAECAVSTLSGSWPFSGTGNSLSGAANTGLADLGGILQFDGQGAVSGTWTLVSNSASTPVQAAGTYTVSSTCVGSISLTDQANNAYAGSLAVFGVDTYGYPNDFQLVMTSPQLIFSGTGRAAFVNPGEALTNNAAFLPGATPAGTVFALFGSDLASKLSQATNVPLPTTLLTTTLFVNGEKAPLFNVQPGQIDAQMPEDIKPGLATVMVTNGTNSNAVSVMVPAVSPEIIVYGNNLAVVTDLNYNVITSAKPAHVGDTVVLWFLGGGAVNASGKLTTGAASPAGLSPVTGPYTITVGGVEATNISYVGLTPESVGLYQASFVVPTGTPTGNQKVVLTISGQDSNAPVMAVK